MPIVTVASGKGGAAKTTTALALAGALVAMQGRHGRPVLLDFDPGSDATRGVGLQPEGQRVAQLFAGESLESQLIAVDEGFAIVPGSAQTAVFETASSSSSSASSKTSSTVDLRSRLADLGKTHLIIVDTSPGISSPLTRAAIAAADVLIVPIVLEPFACDRALHVVDVAHALNAKPAIIFIAAIVDARRSLTASVLEDLESQGVSIATSIPRVVAVAEAPWRGLSIVGSTPRSAAAAAYRHLAELVLSALNSKRRKG